MGAIIAQVSKKKEAKFCEHSTKTTEQYFPVVLLIMLYKVVLSLESADEILKCDRSNESD